MRAFTTPGGVHNATPERIVFGPGTVAEVQNEVARLGASRAVIVTTPGREKLGSVVAELLGQTCVGIIPDAVSQVPIELAERSRVKAADLDADCLVTVGGGAAIGLGKGISLELPLPIVAIPTTYSGSEMTAYCGITIQGVKIIHSDLRMLASAVIYDAELSLTLPPRISAASAMNALAHCVDALPLPTLSPLMADVAIDSARIIAHNLPAMIADPGSLDARNELLYAAYLAGALLSGGFALQHDIAHVLGGSLGVEHGLAHAIVLPHVTEYHLRYAGDSLHRIAAALGADRLDQAVFDLLVASELPTSLQQVGLTHADLDRALQIVTDPGHAPYPNPAPVTVEAIRRILLRSFEGERPS